MYCEPGRYYNKYKTGEDLTMYMKGKYAFLSNYYEYPVTYNGITFVSAETAFQLQKYPKEIQEQKKDLKPWEAKPFGRCADININEWNQKRDRIMEEIVRSKFSDPQLAKRLAAIKGPIVEDNTWGDTYWGVCNGAGLNKLGKILEKLRDELLKN